MEYHQHQGEFADFFGLQSSVFLKNGYILVSFTLILITLFVVTILKICQSILQPMNYELDMTTRKHCKSIAEIDNQVRFKRGHGGELHLVSNNEQDMQQQRAVDCTTDQADGCFENKAAALNDSNNGLQPGSINHVYPNGWIPVIESYKVEAGKVKKAIIFGKDVIVARSLDGKQVSVLDAYCPHMGVHIGVGGRVRQVDNDTCVQCPFHGWTFRASDGQCVDIPYQKCGRIPAQAKLGTWICDEVDNCIFVWHHANNQPPSWFITPSNELQTSNWHLAGRSYHKTNLELRDMLENGADMNHFEGIHNDLFIFGGELTKLQPLKYLQRYTRHHWRPEWHPVCDENGKPTHVAEVKLQSWITLFGLRLFDITIRALQIGPAHVKLFYDSQWYGKGLLIMNSVPVGGRRTKYIQHIYTPRNLFQCFMAKWVLYGEVKMLERDLFIWNHKKNLKTPIFIPEDKTLKQFRLWYSQFYQRKRTVIIRPE